MNFEFPDANADKIKETISKATEEAEKVKGPEKTERERMMESQKEVAEEVAELKTGGVFEKIPAKLKKTVLMVLAGATLFFASGEFNEVEAKSRHNYSDIFKDVFGEVIKDIPDKIEENRERKADQERERQRRIEKEQERGKESYGERREYFEDQRQEALEDYQRDIDRASTNDEINVAKGKYKLKLEAINEAERGN